MVLKVYRFQSVRSYLQSMHLTDISIDAIVTLAKQKLKMVLSTEDLVLIKILRQEKITTIDE